jgi:large subunit ribosomal protein L10
LALTKQRKEEILETYKDWLKRSEAVILVEYTGAKMRDMNAIRSKVRESGGEFHVVKNTLLARALKAQGMNLPDEHLLKSSAMSFAFSDAAATAKALADATRTMSFVKVKAGFMAGELLDAAQVKALSELLPLPAVRAQLLAMVQAPARQLVRTIAEPARGLAAVFKARTEQAAASGS